MSRTPRSRSRLVIEGGRPLSGTVRPRGNKNAALPLLAACLLTDDTVVLENVPDIADVRTLLDLLADLGVSVGRGDDGSIELDASGVNGRQPDPELCRNIRASVLLAGALLGRRGHVELPPPGGDVIGRRRLDTHVLALTALGARFDSGADRLTFDTTGQLVGTEIFLDEASVTGTENALLAAATASGVTTILNAASEPHVQDLCRLLNAMGAVITGVGTNALVIEGKAKLGGARFRLGPDYVEVGSLAVLAAVTGGALTITGARPYEHRAMRLAFGRLGLVLDESPDGEDLIVPPNQELVVRSDLGGAIPKIEDAPWPGFPADLISIALVLATQASGTVLVHQKMFESRLFFVDRLIAMGARIVLCDPHRAVVSGPARLFGQEMSSPDIRAGMAMLIAALCAEGTSVIDNVQQIDRGYEAIDERLRALGADIERQTIVV